MSARVLGELRYYQQVGQPFADLLNNALKPALAAVAVSKYLGTSVLSALLAGCGMVAAILTLSIVMGWLIVRYRVIHASIRASWANDPVTSRQLELLEQIAAHTRPLEVVG